MMAAIHIVWAVMLWRASADPAQHALFIEFTIWANIAHGVVMLIATPMQKGLAMTFSEGPPLRDCSGPVGAKTGARGVDRPSEMSGGTSELPPGTASELIDADRGVEES